MKRYFKLAMALLGGVMLLGTGTPFAAKAAENLESAETVEPDDAGDTYTNPILDNCADPDVLYYKGTYYLYCTTPTQEGNSGIKVYTSTDLVHWTAQGFAFMKDDGWGDTGFWAPDLIERDGIFYMYYTANEHICVATSESPLGPFKQDVSEPMHEYIKEIDAHVFYDEVSDKYYLYFVRFTAGNVVWGAELNDDMKSIKEDTLVQLLRANQGWDEDKARVNEGPFMLVKDGKYYLTYSGSHFESIYYGSGYAVGTSPLGPFEKYEGNPIMQSNSEIHGTGHHCVTVSPDGEEMFIVYHCHCTLIVTDPRKLCIDRMRFTTDADGNTILEVAGPTVTPQAIPSGAIDVDNFIEFRQPDSEPVTVNEAMATEEILEKIPKEISIRTSKNNRNPATIVWDWEDAPEKNSDGESVLKGTAILPTGVENLGEITLEVSTKLLWEQPVLTEELKEQENGISAVVCVSAAAIVTAAVGIIVMMRKHKKTSQS